MRDVVIIGAGIAGLSAAIRLAEAGAQVTLVTKGIGGLQLGQGTIDVLGYVAQAGDGQSPTARRTAINSPLAHIPDYIAQRSDHPYQHFAPQYVADSVTWLMQTVGTDYLIGDPSRNILLPTAVGALRPTCVYPPSMAAGIPSQRPVLVVGLRRLKDFPAQLIADNINRQLTRDGQPMRARAVWANVEIRSGETDTSAVVHARAFDSDDMLKRLAEAIAPHLKSEDVIALPAVIGLADPQRFQKLQDLLGHLVFEIPLQPPSVPGMRLNERMTRIAKSSVRFITGAEVIGCSSHGSQVTDVIIRSAGKTRSISTRNVIVAGGGFESGALEVTSHMQVRDSILNLPVATPQEPLLHGDFWGPDQPLFLSGYAVDGSMRICDEAAQPVYDNVYAAGGNIRGAMRWREKSGEGIALASALTAADSILKELA